MTTNDYNEAHEIIPEMLLAMRDTEIPPHFIYAYRKTGVFVLSEEWQQKLAPGAIKKWDKAIREYFTLEAQAKRQLS